MSVPPISTTAELSRDATLAAAPALVSGFERTIGRVERVPRGVLPSEVFFIVATLGGRRPRQILESGRALGQSTRLLALCYPDTPLVSVEFHRDHPDAEPALRRLQAYPNVTCLFGDSFRVLPPRAGPGDVAVIDGPKDLRALKLAFTLLARGVEAAFIHDCPKGSAARRHLERHVPWAFYSDDGEFVARYCRLDSARKPKLIGLWSDPARQPSDRSYGGTFACIPRRRGFPADADFVRLRLARWRKNLLDWPAGNAAADEPD